MPPNDASQKQDSPPVAFELEQADVYGKYMLTSPVDVSFVLRSVVKQSGMATIYFDHGKSFFLTCLLGFSVDEKNIIFDRGSDESTNRQALKAPQLIVAAHQDNVKIQFHIRHLTETTLNGLPAFLAPIPTTLLRLQRREYFRLETPVNDPLLCLVPLGAKQNPAGQTLEIPLFDISGGGLGLMVPSDKAACFAIGTLYPECHLVIPGESLISVTLCVRGSFPMAGRRGQEYLRVGCEFVGLPGSRLTMIQRYITRIERERKARLSRLG